MQKDPENSDRSWLVLAISKQKPTNLSFSALSQWVPGAPRNVAAVRGDQAIFPRRTSGQSPNLCEVHIGIDRCVDTL